MSVISDRSVARYKSIVLKVWWRRNGENVEARISSSCGKDRNEWWKRDFSIRWLPPSPHPPPSLQLHAVSRDLLRDVLFSLIPVAENYSGVSARVFPLSLSPSPPPLPNFRFSGELNAVVFIVPPCFVTSNYKLSCHNYFSTGQQCNFALTRLTCRRPRAVYLLLISNLVTPLHFVEL